MKHNPYNKKTKARISSPKTAFISKFRFKFRRRLKEKEFTELPKGIFEEKAVYLDNYQAKQRPAWLLPLIIAFVVLLLVFWTGPYILGFLSDRIFIDNNEGDKVILLYDSPDYAVVGVQSADLLSEPDLRSRRTSQVLYNDLVRIVDHDTYGYIYAQLQDGTMGYLMESDISSDTRSVEPGLYSHKLMIVAKSKRIMSHASKGSLLLEVCMGSILFSDYQGDGIYRVSLPGGINGWISSEGVIRTDVDGAPAVSSAKKFYETALSFVNTTYIENGITSYGASSSGIAFICAKINGVDIPREIDSQSKSGTEVVIAFDDVTGLPMISDFAEGDLVFFRNELANPEGVSEMGIVVGQGQVLMSARSANSVRIVTLSDNADLIGSIVAVRRLFTNP
ncbi:MAG: C40 family peptidase [Saccharofermentanales bacterium]